MSMEKKSIESSETTKETTTETKIEENDLGYEVSEEEKAAVEENKTDEEKEEEKVAKEKSEEKSSTGYDDDDKDDKNEDDDKEKEKSSTGYDDEDEDKDKADAEKNTEKSEDKPDEKAKIKKEEIDSLLGKLPEGFDKEKASDFMVKHKLTKEQVEAYVQLSVEDANNFKQAQMDSNVLLRAGWRQELRDDKEFGGENFKQSVGQVDKLMEKYFPDTKKKLTDSGAMLPPYIMKDLLRVSKAFNPKTEMVKGEAQVKVEEESEDSFLDDFYK